MSSLTPDFFNTLIIVVVILGLALAVVRLYADFTRPVKNALLPPDADLQPVETVGNDDDTRPNETAP